MKVLFLGRGELGYQVLLRILENGYEVPVIVTCEHSPEIGRCPDDFQEIADTHNIPFYYTNYINDPFYVDLFRKQDADIAVAMLWVRIIGRKIIETTRMGILNFHAGDLPRYRGNAVINWAILQDESEIGVCVHLMEPDSLDSGPIVVKKKISITSTTTVGELTSQYLQMGPSMILEALDKLSCDEFRPQRQDSKKAMRCFPRCPEDGEIDWHKTTAEIDKLIKSVSKPYPGAFTYFKDKNGEIRKLIIWNAHPVSMEEIVRTFGISHFLGVPGHLIFNNKNDGTSWVVTGDGIIALEKVQFDGNKEFEPGKFFKSIRIHLGFRTTAVLELQRQIKVLAKRLDNLEQKFSQN